MKRLRISGLAMMGVAALVAFAGSASAAGTLTSPSGTKYKGILSITATESLLLKAGFVNFTCTESTAAGTIEEKNNNEEHAAGTISTLSFGNCGSATVDVITNGSLTVKKGTGAVTGSGSEVTISTLGASCVYGTGAGAPLGTLVDSSENGKTASLQISASLPKVSGGFACANPAAWSGKYTVTTPDKLFAD